VVGHLTGSDEPGCAVEVAVLLRQAGAVRVLPFERRYRAGGNGTMGDWPQVMGFARQIGYPLNSRR
jgi:hypothetical protein